MNILIIDDSSYGNTSKVTQALIEGAAKKDYIESKNVKDATFRKIRDFDVLIIGSPTQGGRATDKIIDFINHLPKNALRGVKVAAFDTRFDINEHGRAMKYLMKTIGYASPKIAKSLQQKGGQLAAKPEGFIVNDKTGPLKDGEIERAKKWIKQVTQHPVNL